MSDESNMLPAATVCIPILPQSKAPAPSPRHLPLAGSAGHGISCTRDDKIQVPRSPDLAELYSLASAELLKVQDNRNLA